MRSGFVRRLREALIGDPSPDFVFGKTSFLLVIGESLSW